MTELTDEDMMKILKNKLGDKKYADLLVAAAEGMEGQTGWRESPFAFSDLPDEDYKKYISDNLTDLNKKIPGLKNAFNEITSQSKAASNDGKVIAAAPNE